MVTQEIKEIKRQLRYEVKKKLPGFKSLPKKQKKKALSNILQQIIDNYDCTQPVTAGNYELCNIDRIPANIYTLESIAQALSEFNSGTLPFKLRSKTTAIKDPELQLINELCNWSFVNTLLAPKNYSHEHHDKYPVHLFKAELLKSLKYPELSYRKYCEREINNKERKENRAFIGLRGAQRIHHSQLSNFRAGLSWFNLINIMVYFIYLFLKHKELPADVIYAVDSTELAEKINTYPLVKIKYKGEYVRIYQDIDADCGSRRSKRDKALFVVGYRLHTLTVIDPKTQMAYPLFSLLAAANHHDSNFLEMLIELGKVIGLDLNIVIGDQAYGKDGESEYLHNKHNVIVLNEPKEKKKLPEHVDQETWQVYMNDFCEIPMQWTGKDEQYGHEFHCGDAMGECILAGTCKKNRYIPVDTGVFGQFPYQLQQTQDLCNMRKVAERPFNLLKHREGLEPLRTLGRETTLSVTVIANIATLLIEIAGFRHKKKLSKNNQLKLFTEAA